MSQYDAALGVSAATLDQALSQLYSNQAARSALFAGQEHSEMGGSTYTAIWDILIAPSFVLEPPDDALWTASINSHGEHPTVREKPASNLLQLVFPQLKASYGKDGQTPVSGTGKVIVFATISIMGTTATLSPLAVWLDESQMKGWDRTILNRLILPRVLEKAGQILAGFQIPPLSFKGIDLTPSQAVIAGGLFVLGASLKGSAPVNLSNANWPSQPLFLLVSSELMTQAAQKVAAEKLVGKKLEDSGKCLNDLASYSASCQITGVSDVAPTDARTSVNANVGFSFSAKVELGSGPCAISAAASKL